MHFPFRLLTLLTFLVLAKAALPAQDITVPALGQGVYGLITNEAGEALIGATVTVRSADGLHEGTTTDYDGRYTLAARAGTYRLTVSYVGYGTYESEPLEVLAGRWVRLDHAFEESGIEMSEIVVAGYGSSRKLRPLRRVMDQVSSRPARVTAAVQAAPPQASAPHYREPTPTHANEAYAHRVENGFLRPTAEPLSTFGADVDVAAYANVRRFLDQGQLPPADAVRTEELVNYFQYAYAKPAGEDPVAFSNELGACPWNPTHQLLRIGVQARAIDTDALPPSNLVFLLDVSGSMNQPDKLPLLKQSFRLLVDQLRDEDRVAIVVYAGAAGTVLEPTPGSERDSILSALERLRAGGSTAGGAGIQLAYQLAERHFAEGGNNRVVLATDGDFNVGTTSERALEDLIAEKRESGVFLSVLGFGQGNYQDARMQTLAEAGNGNAAYIDGLLEAQKVLVEEFGGTLHTVAKDVKLQVEFNPAAVAAYRLIGYESRLLAAEDFNDDRKDAGDMGAGHDVTALYEIIPAGAKSAFLPSVEPLKYQRRARKATAAASGSPADLATVRMKYKRPAAKRSVGKIEVTVASAPTAAPSTDFRWAAAVAGWSLLLEDSDHLDAAFSYAGLLAYVEDARGGDEKGYRAEALRLMEVSASLETPELVSEK